MSRLEARPVQATWLRASEAMRRDLQRRGLVTEGWVVLGVAREIGALRALAEYPSTIVLKSDLARLWRGCGNNSHEAAMRAMVGLAHRPDLSAGLDLAVFSLDDPDCPIVPDWVEHDRLMRLTRPRISIRQDFVRRHNIPFRRRETPWLVTSRS